MKRVQYRETHGTLHVNRSAASEQVQVNITTKVNSSTIRREMYNGREHLVLPSYTLPANVVMNGGLYPSSEIDAHYKGIEGTLAPLGHPVVEGRFVSAFSPEGINQGHIGAWNRNVKKSGNRVFVEKWVDIEVASRHPNGIRLLERVAALEAGNDVPPIHTSIAVFLDQLEAPAGSKGYDWVAKIHSVDHDAILLDEVGAATPEQGVGLMVNADQATPLAANSGVLVGESYRELEQRISQAAAKRWAVSNDDYAWVADFTDSQVIIIRNGGLSEVYGYEDSGGFITFSDTGTGVTRQESWVAAFTNSFKSFFNHQARPDITLEGDMPLTPEEKAGLVADIGAAVAANMTEQLNPIVEKISALETNHKLLSDSIQAHSRAEEDEKRKAVAAVHGEVIANALSGEALDTLFKALGTATPIVNGVAPGDEETGAPDPATYFGGK